MNTPIKSICEKYDWPHDLYPHNRLIEGSVYRFCKNCEIGWEVRFSHKTSAEYAVLNNMLMRLPE
jgi:hypothetical protein